MRPVYKYFFDHICIVLFVYDSYIRLPYIKLPVQIIKRRFKILRKSEVHVSLDSDDICLTISVE